MKKVLVVAAVLVVLILGAEINAVGAIKAGEIDGTKVPNAIVTGNHPVVGGFEQVLLKSGDGPSQAIEGVGCHEDWLSDSMKESGITLEMLPKLPVGKEIRYRTNCADTPPADIAAESAKIRAHERARLRAMRAPRTSEPSEEFAGLVEKNHELKEQVAELERKLAAAGTTAVQAPTSKLTDELEKATKMVAMLNGELATAKSERDEARSALAKKQAEVETAERRSRYGLVLMVAVAFLAWLITYLRLTSGAAKYRRKREEVADGIMTESTPLPPIGAPADPSGGNGAGKVPQFSPYFPVEFDGEVLLCPAEVKWAGKHVSPVVYLWCPNEGCPEMRISPGNIKSHLAKCKQERGENRCLLVEPLDKQAARVV